MAAGLLYVALRWLAILNTLFYRFSEYEEHPPLNINRVYAGIVKTLNLAPPVAASSFHKTTVKQYNDDGYFYWTMQQIGVEAEISNLFCR